MKTPDWQNEDIFIVDFEDTSHFILLLTLKM